MGDGKKAGFWMVALAFSLWCSWPYLRDFSFSGGKPQPVQRIVVLPVAVRPVCAR